MTLTHVLIGLAIIFMIVKRQLGTKPIKKRMFVMPLILLGYGIYTSLQIPDMDTAGWVLLSLGTLLGIPVGAAQGYFTQVFKLNGVWMMKGSPAGLVLWLCSIPIRYGLKYGLSFVIPTHALFTGDHAFAPFLFSIAGIVAGRLLGIYWKHPQAARQLVEGA
ncbi:hypothetical protein O9H85_17270 [Paenibacillus filicis]|uniref:DUF1453 domain-containing protein n=1 Tax=Paenibacillus gyeongsangnamensis TaxID=3388067 RepID=A0ABT4QBE3_9BACL|nr:hypothetical protein [Paenibacillus filicis]MCZ8514145.1 hypothetical protein [Paenibacillus filicis]